MVNHFIPIDAPTRKPRVGGIRTVAEFVSTPRLAMGGELEFVSPGCAFPVDDIAFCYPTPGVQADKTFDTGLDTMQGAINPFGLYVGVDCFLGNDNDYDAQARTLLEQGQDRGIEKRVNDYFVSLTGIAATSVMEAIAEAEDYADDNYLGQPVLWVNRGDAIRNGRIKDDTDLGIMFTPNGTPVVSSGKIAKGTVGLTGSVTVAHSPIVVNRVSVHTVNRERAIAEAVYAVAFDCEFARVYEVS